MNKDVREELQEYIKEYDRFRANSGKTHVINIIRTVVQHLLEQPDKSCDDLNTYDTDGRLIMICPECNKEHKSEGSEKEALEKIKHICMNSKIYWWENAHELIVEICESALKPNEPKEQGYIPPHETIVNAHLGGFIAGQQDSRQALKCILGYANRDLFDDIKTAKETQDKIRRICEDNLRSNES